jgi:hypothetical protein
MQALNDVGWFETGDTAEIDASSIVCLDGHTNDLIIIIIQGVMYLAHELETETDHVKILGVAFVPPGLLRIQGRGCVYREHTNCSSTYISRWRARAYGGTTTHFSQSTLLCCFTAACIAPGP